jgi:hypothetical protein
VLLLILQVEEKEGQTANGKRELTQLRASLSKSKHSVLLFLLLFLHCCCADFELELVLVLVLERGVSDGIEGQ